LTESLFVFPAHYKIKSSSGLMVFMPLTLLIYPATDVSSFGVGF
jgi:hypothetical protein